MEIEEVVDEQTLVNFLSEFPEESRKNAFDSINVRSALRTAPIALSYFLKPTPLGDNGTSVLSFFLAIALLHSGYVKERSREARNLERLMDVHRRQKRASVVSRLMRSAGSSKADQSVVPALSAVANAASSIVPFVGAVEDEAAMPYPLTGMLDAQDYATGLDLNLVVLARNDISRQNYRWLDAPDVSALGLPTALQDLWNAVSSRLKDDKSKTDWRFWIAWYERILNGKSTHAEMLLPILDSLGEEDRLRDPDRVNARFAEVLEVYRAEDAQALVDVTPLAEEVVYDQPLGVLKLEPKDRIAPEYLETILFQIDEAIELFDYPDEAINPLPLSREIKILRSIREKFAHRPVNILKTLGSVVERLDTKIANGECPATDKDADIAHFRRNLSEAMLDLVGFSPEVQDYHNAKKPPVSAENAEELAGLAKKIADFANEALATLLSEAAFTLLDPTVDPYSRRTAQYWIVGVVARTYKIGRQLLKEAKELDDEVKVGIGLVALVTNPKFWEVIGNVIRIFIK